MFSTVTRNLVEEIDEGDMIPVSSLSDTIVPLTLVIKRKSFWFWRKPKYLPTDFTLNDVLIGETPIQPVVNQTDILKYSGTFGSTIEVGANTSLGTTVIEGSDTSKLQSSGSLTKEELDVQKLLEDSKDRVLDMAHPLIQQTRVKHREVFGLVKERIMTTQPFSIVEDIQQGGQLGGVLSICLPNTVKVSLKPNWSLHKDSNIKFEIPANAVVAYSLLELQVKDNGLYELCLMSDTLGGFEVDSPVETTVEVSSASARDTSYSSDLKQALDRLSPHFQLLSAVPARTRSTLLQLLRAFMEDQQAVTLLEGVLEQLCSGKSPLFDDDPEDVLRLNTQALLDLLDQTDECIQRSVHLIVSALDEMLYEGLALLSSCCSPIVLQALHALVECVAGSRDPSDLACFSNLTGEVYDSIERLFSVSNVVLKKEGSVIRTEVCQHPDNCTLFLCIAVKGLASLAHNA